MNPTRDSVPSDDAQRAALQSVRTHLLRLHKALLETERLRYEREHGRVEGGLQLFNLVSNDPAFAWLRPLLTLVVQYDEKLDEKEGLSAADVRLLMEEAGALLAPDRNGAEFQRNYDRAIQENPDVLILHTKVEPLLRR